MNSIDLPSLGDRMKEYENVTRTHLIRRMPAILRLDGRAFHTFTKKFNKPFDELLHHAMVATTVHLMSVVQTAVLAYTQSDEISLLLKDYTKLETQAWFGANIQKMVSISAAEASVHFNMFPALRTRAGASNYPVFDARIFNIPKEDVANYFLWRQQDTTRNSINSLGQTHFSHADLMGKSQADVLEMLRAQGIEWASLPTIQKRGTCVYYDHFEVMNGVDGSVARINTEQFYRGKLEVDLEMPIITGDREYIDRHL